MTKNNTLLELCRGLREKQEAIAFLHEIKREAQADKRACGQTENPIKAIPGLEQDFEKCSNAIRYCDRLLQEMQKTVKHKRQKTVIPDFAKSTMKRFLDIWGILSLAGIGLVGIAFVSVILHIKIPFLICGAMVVATGIELWNRRTSEGKGS